MESETIKNLEIMKNTITSFNGKAFESELIDLFTFQGHNNSFCIMLNAKCVHSVKSKNSHIKKLNELIKKHDLIEIL